MELKLSDFYYDLPKELIAQDPLEDRSSSRLMHIDRKTGAYEHKKFTDVIDYLNPGDCLVLNNTKVIPARLFGVREKTENNETVLTTGKIEVLLLKRRENDIWETLVKPGKKCKPGTKLNFGNGKLRAEVLDVVEDGNRLIQFRYDGIFEEILDELGQMPLPPYITHELKDKNRYQTVYAKYEGSAAAPTAGLHFTKELLEEIQPEGCHHCKCNTSCRTWHIPSGKSGKCTGTSYALRILYHFGRRSTENQSGESFRTPGNFRGNDQLPCIGIRSF
jgi:S-adenosylmethionine:tRNA ribosyltransferase-isomerase